ncbi:protein-glutamine gamma-glutamyltransferase [Paenibacillus alvei]|uniref:Protein-glutamine gamma-glutamyltransferase n=1 Tax=Paenibacillus alvei TaxID=44250 RepID=A0ABT4GXC1_PAEAL|nr:protein-glutamine gamma-glutamyltransferase [Paenibacillus alvei]MCY9761064.1 protein-glutamine gamma-glutamyltransferase [Paenibacillus alvei]MCY9767105.1 protein-glutamine gamma-glutamyltransferase [Paenibacillus alvei]
MIEIAGVNTGQLAALGLTELERSVLTAKQKSPVVYSYNSLDDLKFELKMRSNIVKAAKALHNSGADFAGFDDSRCNKRYWIRTDRGGFQLRSGVMPSTAINDIFHNGDQYAFECATAIVIVLYKAVIDTLGEAVFNRYFQDLLLWDWNYDRNLRLVSNPNLAEAYVGDILYFKNPDYNPRTPEWQGENVVKLGNDLYYGHGIGITSSQGMITALNKARKPGSKISAYLSNEVVNPDFDALRQLQYGRSNSITAAVTDHDGWSISAKIGTKTYIYPGRGA